MTAFTTGNPAFSPEDLAALLDRLTPGLLAGQRAALLSRPEGDFVQGPGDVLPMLAPALAPTLVPALA